MNNAGFSAGLHVINERNLNTHSVVVVNDNAKVGHSMLRASFTP
jgi:hypothetical protein